MCSIQLVLCLTKYTPNTRTKTVLEGLRKDLKDFSYLKWEHET